MGDAILVPFGIEKSRVSCSGASVDRAVGARGHRSGAWMDMKVVSDGGS